jgi:hypothetical protein
LRPQQRLALEALRQRADLVRHDAQMETGRRGLQIVGYRVHLGGGEV